METRGGWLGYPPDSEEWGLAESFSSAGDAMWYKKDDSEGGMCVCCYCLLFVRGIWVRNPNSDPAISCDCQAAVEGSSLAARGSTETWLMMSHPHPPRHITTTNANMYILRTTMPWVWDFLCFQLASLSQPSKVCDIKLRSPRVCDRIILCKRGGIHSHWLVANTSN